MGKAEPSNTYELALSTGKESPLDQFMATFRA